MEALIKFHKEVDTSSRFEMIKFLIEHPKYYVLNSWNKIKTFSNKVKLYGIIPSKLLNNAFEMLGNTEAMEMIGDETFYLSDVTNNEYEVNQNGRSGGYYILVKKDNNLTHELYRIASFEDETDFEFISNELLKEFVETVQYFDSACDYAVARMIDLCENFELVDEEIQITKTVKVLKEKHNENTKGESREAQAQS